MANLYCNVPLDAYDMIYDNDFPDRNKHSGKKRELQLKFVVEVI